MAPKVMDYNIAAMVMADVLYRKNVNAVKTVMDEYGYRSRRVSFFKEQYESLCLVCNEGAWEVYFLERMSKSGLKAFDDIDDACRCMLKWISQTVEDEKGMVQEYDNIIMNSPNDPVPLKALYNALAKIASMAVF